MKRHQARRPLLRAAFSILASAMTLAGASQAQENDPQLSADLRTHAGRAIGYQQLDRASLESVTTPARLMRVAQGGFAPTEIWRALEHGERVECLDCIPYVSDLLYNDDAKTREISAWWLRRRIGNVIQGVGLFPHMTVTENIAITPRLLGWPRKQRDMRAD